MKLERVKLLEILDKLKPGLSKDEFVKQAGCFIFENDKIKTYNDLISIECDFKTELRGAVKSKEFHELLKKFPDEFIEITQEKNQFVVKGKKRKAGVYIENEILIPKINCNLDNLIDLPENFIEAISFCLFSTSKDLSIPYQTCIYLKEDKATSFDGYRATVYKLDTRVDSSFLLQAKVAKELINYDPIKYVISDNFIHFVNDNNIVFSSRQFEDDFVDLKEFLDVKGKIINLPNDFDKITDRVSILAGIDTDGDKFIEIEIDNNKLICKGKGDSGWIEEEIRMRYDGEKIKFIINPLFIKEIIEYTNSVMVGERLTFNGEFFKHVMVMSD